MKRIPIGNGLFVLVDKEDYEICARHRWHFHGGSAGRSIKRFGKYTVETMGRFLLGVNDDKLVRFANGNRLDCSRNNLVITNNRWGAI
jgi:hypothetical protein